MDLLDLLKCSFSFYSNLCGFFGVFDLEAVCCLSKDYHSFFVSALTQKKEKFNAWEKTHWNYKHLYEKAQSSQNDVINGLFNHQIGLKIQFQSKRSYRNNVSIQGKTFYGFSFRVTFNVRLSNLYEIQIRSIHIHEVPAFFTKDLKLIIFIVVLCKTCCNLNFILI